MLEKFLNFINDEKALNIVDDVDKQLTVYKDEGYINDFEKDALRHYFGMKKLSNQYGGTVAWLAGILHEHFGAALLLPENNPHRINAEADLFNNNIALDHAENNMGVELDSITTIEDIREPLNVLKIPSVDAYSEDY